MLEWYNGKLLLADTLSCVNITLDHIVYKYEKNMQNLLSIWLWFHIFHFVVFAMPVLTALCTVYALSADIFVAYDTWWISFSSSYIHTDPEVSPKLKDLVIVSNRLIQPRSRQYSQYACKSHCRILSSQCIIQEITEFLLNILASFFVQPLFHALNFYIGRFHKKFD